MPSHSYIQYTATPQGPLLNNLIDLLSPKHHTVLTPGESYTGGKVFFKKNPDLIITIPDEQVHHQNHNPLSVCPGIQGSKEIIWSNASALSRTHVNIKVDNEITRYDIR